MKIKHKFFGIFAILCLILSLGVVVALDVTEDDVANTALYLSSNLSSSITGQIIPVCSGLIRLE